MKEEFKKLSSDIREKLFSLSLLGWGIDNDSKIHIEKLKSFILRSVRLWKSNLSRDSVNDIFWEFEVYYKDYRLNYHKTELSLYNKTINSYDSMISELLISFHEKEINTKKSENSTYDYVNQWRIDDLLQLNSNEFDLKKLIRLCEELNIAYRNKAYYSVGFLVRIIKDHIPPIFWKKSFAEVAANIWAQSIKNNLQHLERSLKNIADDMAHGAISGKEILPNEQKVSFQADLDVLLWQIIIKLSKP